MSKKVSKAIVNYTLTQYCEGFGNIIVGGGKAFRRRQRGEGNRIKNF
jgi:hypothetical protein